jgi:tetratricopeptide (TPR) repeat protein
MIRIQRMNYVAAATLIALVAFGCQTSNNRWAAAWKERSKPKPQFKGLEPESKEEVTYWPYKADKKKQNVSASASKFRDKLARESDQKKLEARVIEAINDGDALRKSGQLEDARVAYNKALKLAPESADVHHRLAIVADKQGDYAAADEHYQAALRVRPQDANLLSDMGYSYSLRGKKEKAEQTLKKALEIEPSHKFAMANLGRLYVQQNRYNDALAMCRAGTNSEADAQQCMAYIARMNMQDVAPGQNGQPSGSGPGQSGPMMASTTRDNVGDLSKLDFEQVKALMAREKEEAVRRRWQNDQQQLRNLPVDDGIDQQRMLAANPGNPAQNYSDGPLTIGPQGQMVPGTPNFQYSNNQSTSDGANGPIATNVQTPTMNGPYSSITPGGPTNVPNSQQNSVNQAQLYADARYSQPSNQNRGGYQQLPPGRQGNPPIQQAGAQQLPSAATNNPPPTNDQVYASQMATRIGMCAGPGGMFPMVAGSENDSAPPAAPNVSNVSFNNRFGGEFQQAPAYQNAQNWGANSIDQTSSTQTNRTEPIDGAPNIAPQSPMQNWQPPTSGGLNWQSSTTTNVNWASDNPPGSGAAGSGIDSGVSLLRSDQESGPRVAQQGGTPAGANSFVGSRNNNNLSKPYSGTWPNKNSLPAGPPQNNVTGNRSSDGIQIYGSNPPNSGVSINPGNQSGGSGGSLPQYPFAPNR